MVDRLHPPRPGAGAALRRGGRWLRDVRAGKYNLADLEALQQQLDALGIEGVPLNRRRFYPEMGQRGIGARGHYGSGGALIGESFLSGTGSEILTQLIPAVTQRLQAAGVPVDRRLGQARATELERAVGELVSRDELGQFSLLAISGGSRGP